MHNQIRTLICQKRVLILGFGKEGRSTYRLLRSIGGYLQLDIADKVMNAQGIEEGHAFLSGDGYMDTMDLYDIAFKSPGIVLPKHPDAYHCRITSQTEIFIKHFNRQIVGVTGTKGKSTVASLIHHILCNNGVECLLAGNIGKPVFDIVDLVTKQTVIVLELSCHQLEYCAYSPAVSFLLNIYEDHLDHYASFEHYVKAKTNIYTHQSALDTLYCNPNHIPAKEDCVSRVIPVNTACLPFKRFESANVINLRGTHNLLNCAFVYSLCQTFSISDDDFISALRTYQPLPHRLQYIGSKNGVEYYDDSISTTVESAINAINSIHNTDVVLLGGMDRGINFTSLVRFLISSQVTYVILMYESGKKIYEMLMDECKNTKTSKHTFMYVPDLYQATELAQQYAMPGKACVLSPASASYGDFIDFEERGEIFKKLIMGS